MKRLWLLSFVISCASAPLTRLTTEPVEGLIRQRGASCESRGFVLARVPTPVVRKHFLIREASASGRVVAEAVTNDVGAFQAVLATGVYCFVDALRPDVCLAVLRYDPNVEPIPVVTLPSAPCVP